MSRKLFEDEATQPRTRRNRLRVLLWLLVLLMLITIGTLVTLITLQPNLVGLMRVIDFNQTNAALEFTAVALQSTDQNNLQRGLNLENTQAALDNYASRLAQTETQQMLNSNTTNTAVALANAQQSTQAAMNFQNTQVALQQVSTEIQQEFEATQTALSSSFATIEANRPLENVILLNGNFVRGTESAEQIVPSSAWAVSDTGSLIAQQDHATALIRLPNVPENYTLNVRITPKTTAADYDVLFGVVEGGGGYTLRLYHNGTQLTGAALFPIQSRDLPNPAGLPVEDNQAVSVVDALNITASELAVEVRIDALQISASVNGFALFTTPVSALNPGAVGVQLRAGAQLQTLLVVPRS